MPPDPEPLSAGDGHILGGTWYLPVGAPRAAALIACGGGVPAARYAHFADYLSTQGVATLTFDYRGIGRSRPLRLRGFAARIEDWSEHDAGGALACLVRRYPGLPRIGIAHSIGALLLLGAPGTEQLTRLMLVSPHTGFWGDYHPRYRLPMALVWHGVMPALTRLRGYFPGRALRLGEDIPAGIALQWAQRRSATMTPQGTPEQVERAKFLLARCERADLPACVISVEGDAFATNEGIRRFLALVPRLQVTHWRVTPGDAGVNRLGHFGFFSRRSRARLWPEFLHRALGA